MRTNMTSATSNQDISSGPIHNIEEQPFYINYTNDMYYTISEYM